LGITSDATRASAAIAAAVTATAARPSRPCPTSAPARVDRRRQAQQQRADQQQRGDGGVHQFDARGTERGDGDRDRAQGGAAHQQRTGALPGHLGDRGGAEGTGDGEEGGRQDRYRWMPAGASAAVPKATAPGRANAARQGRLTGEIDRGADLGAAEPGSRTDGGAGHSERGQGERAGFGAAEADAGGVQAQEGGAADPDPGAAKGGGGQRVPTDGDRHRSSTTGATAHGRAAAAGRSSRVRVTPPTAPSGRARTGSITTTAAVRISAATASWPPPDPAACATVADSGPDRPPGRHEARTGATIASKP